jgi:serine protease Do
MTRGLALALAILSSGFLASSLAIGAEFGSYADIVDRVLPSVVNISIEGAGERVAIGGDGGDAVYATYLVEYVGAGSITDPSGIIVTNRHVINNAHEITVTLQDGSAFRAKLLGKGVDNDLAILKIDAGRPLPAVKVGDSDKVRVGDHVLAIGNPLGLGGSVSAGIVSGLHRHISSGIALQNTLGEFIQTDAAINHGNSGGPLFNMKGEVIGVDNQIFSDFAGGGNVGLGFAIPSNDVKFMLQQVLQEGKPRLGWIGVRLQTVTPRMAGALGNQVQGGAIVSEVAPNSPGSEVGLRVGDVVQSVDNERITDSRTVDRAVVSAIGKTIQLGVWSNGKTRNVPVAVKEFPQDVWISYKNEKTADLVFTKISDAGFEVADLTDELRAKFHIDPGVKGVVITAVADNTAASGANIRPGYVILKVQMDDVHSRAELAQHLQKLADRGQRDVLLFVRGSNGSVWLTLPMRL